MKHIRGGMSAIVKAMLLNFFSKDVNEFNFKTTGLRVPTETDVFGHIRADSIFFIEDEKACKIGFDVKGASGCKCCFGCQAFCGAKLHPPEGSYYVRHDEPDRSKWDPHTIETIKECIKAVDDAKGTGVGALQEVETNIGINYNPYGPLWDPYLVDLLDPPNCHYWDAMHCLYSSGGVAQFQANGYIYWLTKNGISLQDLDRFSTTVKGHRLKSKTFFQDRFVNDPLAHLKVFASECVDVVLVLNVHIDLVVGPSERMPEHVKCLQLLGEIAKILGKPQDIMRNLTVLEDKLHDHHVLYNRCGYKRIPKNHYLRHLPDCAAIHKIFMTCWAPERDHSNSKELARDCFNKCEKTILVRMNYQFFNDLADKPTILQETYLKDPLPCNTFDEMLGDGADVTASQHAVTVIGELGRGAYVWIVDVSAMVPVLCTVETFLHVRMPREADGSVQVMCTPLAYHGENKWLVQDVGRQVVEPVSHLMSRAFVYADPTTPCVVHARP